jgi:hypothetical protein
MTATELDRIAQPRPVTLHAGSEATAIEQARSVAEVAAAVRVAQDNPRDEAKALERMRQACNQRSLADRAFWTLPRGGKSLRGSSVHLAREIARCWGNLDYGIRELRRDDDAGVSEMQAWAWDQENNVRSARSFIVPHAIMANKQRKVLTDLADIANNNNSVAARAVRETIFSILPVWFRDEAEEIANRTLQGGGGDKPLAQQVADMVKLYADTFNVTAGQMETRLERPRTEWTATDLGFFRVLGGEMNRGEKSAAQEFNTAAPAAANKVTAADITDPGDVPTPEPERTDGAGS